MEAGRGLQAGTALFDPNCRQGGRSAPIRVNESGPVGPRDFFQPLFQLPGRDAGAQDGLDPGDGLPGGTAAQGAAQLGEDGGPEGLGQELEKGREVRQAAGAENGAVFIALSFHALRNGIQQGLLAVSQDMHMKFPGQAGELRA